MKGMLKVGDVVYQVSNRFGVYTKHEITSMLHNSAVNVAVSAHFKFNRTIYDDGRVTTVGESAYSLFKFYIETEQLKKDYNEYLETRQKPNSP